MSLKEAVGWSVVIHMGLMMVRPPHGVVPPRESLHTLEVTYLPEKQGSHSLPKGEPVKAQVKPLVLSHSRERVEVPIPQKVPVQEPLPTRPSQPVAPEPERKPDLLDPPEPTKHQAVTSLPEGEFAAVEYKQRVRLHLKRYLGYPLPFVQGSVRLRIVLKPDGLLEEVAALDASDPRLAGAALQGARSAEPYPHFPPALKKPRTHYDFLVQYRTD